MQVEVALKPNVLSSEEWIDMSIIFRTLHQDLHSRAKKLILVQIFEKNHSKLYLRATVTIFP